MAKVCNFFLGSWRLVWEHGSRWEEAEGDGTEIQAIHGGRRWHSRWSVVLPWPGWLHDWNMWLRQSPRGSYRRRDGTGMFPCQPAYVAATAAAADKSDSAVSNCVAIRFMRGSKIYYYYYHVLLVVLCSMYYYYVGFCNKTLINWKWLF